ncbi:unnamed protein product, partial [Symbiodinium pilosum]
MLSDPNDEESTYEHELKFYVSGHNVNKVDGSLVCPAWMVPPTDLRYPILSVRESTHSFTFKGKMLQYDMTYLGMPLHDGDDDLDPARSTPVLVKVIKGSAFALLMRSHLLAEEWKAKKTLKRPYPGHAHAAGEESWPLGDDALAEFGLAPNG